jgi:hypothetical protein
MPAYYESKHAIGHTLANTSCGKLYDSRTWQAELGTAPFERAVSNVTKLKLYINSNVGYTMHTRAVVEPRTDRCRGAARWSVI